MQQSVDAATKRPLHWRPISKSYLQIYCIQSQSCTRMVIQTQPAIDTDQLPPSSQPASRLTRTCSKLCIPPALVKRWQLSTGTSPCQVEMNGACAPGAGNSCTATLSQTASGMHTWVCLPSATISFLAGTFFRGLRRSEDGTLVMIQSTTELPLLTMDQCMVSIEADSGHNNSWPPGKNWGSK